MRNVFEDDEKGRLLLRCIRAYVELDILASFEVHTDETIGWGKKVVDRFVKLANVNNLFSIRENFTANTLRYLGLPKGGLELPENAPHPTFVRRHRGEGHYPKFHHEDLREDAWPTGGLLCIGHEFQKRSRPSE